MTSGLEMEWDYSGRKEKDGQKEKIVKATEKRKSKKEQKTRKCGDKGERRCPGRTQGYITNATHTTHLLTAGVSDYDSLSITNTVYY